MEVQESSNTEETKQDVEEPALEKEAPVVEEPKKDVDGAPEAPEDDKMDEGNEDKDKDEDDKMDQDERGNFDDEVFSSQYPWQL